MRSAGTAILVVLALIAALLVWRGGRGEPDRAEREDVGPSDGARGRELTRDEPSSDEDSTGERTDEHGEEPSGEAPSDETPRRRETGRASAAAADVSVDPCAEPERIERHDRLDELVNARLAELRDRARLVMNDDATSAPLREALVAVLSRGETSLAVVEPAVRAPDRLADGFDLVANLYLTLAVRSDEREPRAAEQAIERAVRVAPGDAVPHVLRAIRRIHAHDLAGFRDALREAFARDREEPAIAIELAYALARTTDHAAAIDATSAYLAIYPRDPEASRLRARIERRAEGVGPDPRSRSARGVTVLYPRSVSDLAAGQAIEIVARALDEAARLLDVPRREELAVLVHRDHDAMLRAMCGQSWTAAAYDGVLHLDVVLFDARETSDAMREGVLRHETLHAALHERPRDVPYWADEGIAQRFAGLEDPSAAHDFARLVRDHTYVPLASLDGAFLDIDDPADARLAYHQSLAMIDWLVAQRGERGIAELVARLSATTGARDPATILGEITGRRFDGETLLAFLSTR